jgi:hypothetical protein
MRPPLIVKSGQQHLLGNHPGCSFSLLAILLSWLLISCTDIQDSRRYFAVFSIRVWRGMTLHSEHHAAGNGPSRARQNGNPT